MDVFQMQRQHLADARSSVMEGRERVRQQIETIRRLRTDGRDTSQALQLLVALRDAVSLGRQRKALIETALRDEAMYCRWPRQDH